MKKFESFIFLLIFVITSGTAVRVFTMQIDPALRRPVSEPLPVHGAGFTRWSNGLLLGQYDLDKDGESDYYTLRRKDSAGMPMAHPIYYAYDQDQDGVWELVWTDVAEDGLNGNEYVYKEVKKK